MKGNLVMEDVFRMYLPRHKGFNFYVAELSFSIKPHGLFFSYDSFVRKSSNIDSKKCQELEEDDGIVLAKGLVVPVKNNSHDGKWLITYPQKKQDIIDSLYYLNYIQERIHDCCSFAKHFAKYVVVNKNKTVIGTFEDILRYSSPSLFN